MEKTFPIPKSYSLLIWIDFLSRVAVTEVLISQVDRGVKSPADISMDITKLVQKLNICPTPFKDGVKLTLAAEASL